MAGGAILPFELQGENAMRRAIPAVLILAGCLALCPSAHAQSGLGRIANQIDMAQKNFAIADRDHDGLLSREEAEKGPVPFIRADFDAIDREHRGLVSKDDVAAYIRSLRRAPERRSPAAAASAH
jgi:hypothetical protein